MLRTIEEKYNIFIDKFIPQKNKDSEDLYYQSFLLVSAHFFSLLFLFLFMLLHYSLNNNTETYALSISFIVFCISLILYPSSGNNIIFGNLVIFGGFVSFFIIAITDGGLHSQILPWFTAISVTGFLFANKISGYIWTLITITMLTVFSILSFIGYSFSVSISEQYRAYSIAASTIGSSGYLVLIVLSYEYLSNKKNKKLKKVLQISRERQEELLQQQEEITAQREMLEESGRQLGIILDSLPDPTFMINNNGIVTFWNKAMAEITGVEADDILGKGNYAYSIPFYGTERPILIDLADMPDQYLSENYSGIHRLKNILQAETYVPNLRGVERYLVGRATALHDDNGNHTGSIEIIHDITIRRKIQDKIEKQNKNIDDSIHYAKRIQKAVFPTINNLDNYLKDFFIFLKPRDIVSGDFYWTIEHNNKLFVVAADCTGHGVPGAFMSLLGISYLNEIILDHNVDSPEKILEILREKVIKSLHQGENTVRDGMDMAIAIFDPKERNIEYAGAHNSIIIIRDNNLLDFKADRMSVGVCLKKSERAFTKQTIPLKPNDHIYMFSDGYRDQFHPKKGKIKWQNFKKLLMNVNNLEFALQKKKIGKFLDDWKEDTPQTDDILVIGFTVNLPEME